MKNTKKSIKSRIEKATARLAESGPMLKGTIGKVKIGMNDGRKSAYQITWKGAENKTRTLYVPHERLADAKKMTAAYKKARALIERLAELNAELYKVSRK